MSGNASAETSGPAHAAGAPWTGGFMFHFVIFGGLLRENWQVEQAEGYLNRLTLHGSPLFFGKICVPGTIHWHMAPVTGGHGSIFLLNY